MEHVEESLALLSDALFWEGYEIWRKRKALVKTFWQDIAPKEWKVGQKSDSKKRKRKMRINCKNPFHFCEKLADWSKQRRTVCACSDIKRQIKSQSQDIRYFLTKYPQRVASDNHSSYFQQFINTVVCPPKNFEALVRDELVRKEHDRGKNKNGDKTG